jgi:WD40 repeat protein
MGIIIALTIVLGAIGAGVAVWLNAGPSPIAVDTCARGAGGPAVPRKIEDLLTGGKKKDFVGVAFSSDCRILATAGDGTVQVWNMVSAQRIATLAAAPDSVTLGMSFAPNGETLAVAAADGPTTLWNIATGQLITSLPSDPNGTYAVAFNRDGTELFTGGSTGVVDIWDVSTHQLIHKISTGDAVGDLALSPNGKLLAVGGDDGNNRLYDAATGAQFKTLRGGEMHVFTMVFSPDGTILATGTRDGVVQWWDVTTHQLIASTRSFGSVTDLAFSPDGKFLAAGGEGTVQLLDTSTHELAARLSVGSADWPQGLAFNRYGGILAVGWEGTLQLWNVAGITHAPG